MGNLFLVVLLVLEVVLGLLFVVVVVDSLGLRIIVVLVGSFVVVLDGC